MILASEFEHRGARGTHVCSTSGETSPVRKPLQQALSWRRLDGHPWARLLKNASSGKVTRRRLNRGGDRQANHALWRIALVRMRSEPRTRAYVERRLEEGRSKLEIIRVLKRYIAREVYRYLPRG